MKCDPFQEVQDIVHGVTGAGAQAAEFLEKHPLGHDCPVCRKLNGPETPTVHELLVAIRIVGWCFAVFEADMPFTREQERIFRNVLGPKSKRGKKPAAAVKAPKPKA